MYENFASTFKNIFIFFRYTEKYIDEKVAKSVKLLTGNAEDNTEQGESYV